MLAAPLPANASRDLAAKLCGAALAALLLIVIVGLGISLAQKTMNSTGEGNIFRQGLYILVFGFVVIAARGFQTPRIFLSPPVTLWLLIAWCWISLSWSLEPSITLRRLFLTTMIIMIIFMIVERTGYERAVRTVLVTLILVLFLNYAMVIVNPTAGIHQARDILDPELAGDWKGILPQKNYTGAICAITIILLVFSGGWIHPLIRFSLAAASAFFLYKTGSKTSMILIFAALIVGGLFLRSDPRFRTLLAPTLIICAGLSVLFGQFYWTDILSRLSQGDALTGRGLIWSVLAAYARDHWLLGTGYAAFWNIGDDSPVYDYTASWVRELGTGHNGYLDMLVTTGVIGLALTLAALVIAPMSRLLWSRTIDRSHGALLISMLLFCICHNVTETSLMDRDSIVQVFFMLTLALILEQTRSLPETPGPLYFAWTGRFEPKPTDPTASKNSGAHDA